MMLFSAMRTTTQERCDVLLKRKGCSQNSNSEQRKQKFRAKDHQINSSSVQNTSRKDFGMMSFHVWKKGGRYGPFQRGHCATIGKVTKGSTLM